MCASSDEQISGVVETNKRDFGYATRFNFMRLIRTILLQRFNESVHSFIIITWPCVPTGKRVLRIFFFFLVTRRSRTNYAIVEKHGDEEEEEEKGKKTRGGTNRLKKKETSSISRPLYRDSICFFERRKCRRRRCRPPRACQNNTRR